ncbi:MAG TPA: phosphoribosylglycinamide formyltransferase [Bacteroidales bacterium]|nr:phosphoribosylglycinamide formyltransferase [Bacteroidales bacterium]
MRNIIILASGSGSNAENIIQHFAGREGVRVSHVLTNRSDAYVLERAKRLGVSTKVFDRTAFYDNNEVLDFLRSCQPDLIVLAGFLWLVPAALVEAFPQRIINIHPALLPAYGGKGMYGAKVHEAVVANGDGETGITIHYVNTRYDEGAVIFQARCPVAPGDSAEQVAQKVHALEYEHFPRVIEELLQQQGRP